MSKRAGKSLQEIYAPHGVCFGCGPCNPDGLHIRSFAEEEEVTSDWQPQQRHESWEGSLGGGIIGVLLDCHMNWTAAHHLLKKTGAERLPCTVTAEYHVKLLRPTPTDKPVHLRARVVDSSDRRATVEGELIAGGEACATGRGTFVAVKPGHPAYHRWEK